MDKVERNLLLYGRLRNGEQAAVNEMIEANLDMVKHRCDMLIGCDPELAFARDEAESEGMVALVEAVQALLNPELEIDKPTGYLRGAITNRIVDTLQSEMHPLVSGGNARRLQNSATNVPSQVRPEFIEISYEINSAEETMEEILSCCDTEMEREIVRLKAEGLNDDQVGEKMDMARITVFRLRRDIYSRYLEKTGLPGEP